jgi:hypothetical protein
VGLVFAKEYKVQARERHAPWLELFSTSPESYPCMP